MAHPTATAIIDIQVILTNLYNAKQVWGEGSKQHEACKQLAREVLSKIVDESQAGKGKSGTLPRDDDLIKQLECLALSSPPRL